MDIFKVFTLEAAHRLPNVPPGHRVRARGTGSLFRSCTCTANPAPTAAG